MASEADAKLLAQGGKSDFHFGDRLSYPPVTADRIMRDGENVELGGITMTAHLTPGHTKGCTTWTMKVKEGLKLYDVVFVGSSTVPGYKLVDNPQYPTIAADYERTFRVLRNLPCDVFLASHGSFYSMLEKKRLLAQGKKSNPFIDAPGYRRFIAQTERAFRDELSRQEQVRANGRASVQHIARPARVSDVMPAFLYLYVDEFDTTYQRALEAGAVSLEEPKDLPYGDRRGMVQDPLRNHFANRGRGTGR